MIPPGPAAEPPHAPDCHAIVRARERYGVEISLDDLGRAQADIAAGKSILLRKVHDKSEHILRVKGVPVRVVVAANGHIMTFLPPTNAARRAQRKRRRKKARPKKCPEP